MREATPSACPAVPHAPPPPHGTRWRGRRVAMPDPIQTPVLADPGGAVSDSSLATAPPAGHSRPAPETGETQEQESKRLTDAQRKMHAATTEAAALRTENAELMQTLQAVLSDPQFAPIAVPAPP